MSQPSLRLQPVSSDSTEFQKTVAFMHLVWPGNTRLTSEYMRWLYFENPSGAVIGMNAWENEKLVGHYVVVPIDASFKGQSKKAALSLNTAVHPDFRGRGLFKTLAEAAYEIAAKQGVDHIVGVANANSTAGFTRSLKFQLVSPLAARIFIGSPHFELSSQPMSWKRTWNSASLSWRLKNPACPYTYQKQPDLFEIDGPTPYPGLKAALSLTNDPEQCKVIEKQLVSRKQIQPRLWIGLSRQVKFGASFSIPKSLRKAPLNLIFRSLSRPEEKLDPEQVEFSGIDFDVV